MSTINLFLDFRPLCFKPGQAGQRKEKIPEGQPSEVDKLLDMAKLEKKTKCDRKPQQITKTKIADSRFTRHTSHFCSHHFILNCFSM